MIDLTPLEVRKKKTDFRRIMRGYDPAMVDDFLELVADRLDQLVRENMALKERANRQEQQVADFRERERALTEALVTAQEMREEIRKQTSREADLARQAAEQESGQLRAAVQQEVAQLRTAAEQEVAQLRARAEQEVAQQRAAVQQEAAQLRAVAQQEAQELRSTVRQEREREEEALRRIRAQLQHYITTYRTLLERELAELTIAAQTLGIGSTDSPHAALAGAAGAALGAGALGTAAVAGMAGGALAGAPAPELPRTDEPELPRTDEPELPRTAEPGDLFAPDDYGARGLEDEAGFEDPAGFADDAGFDDAPGLAAAAGFGAAAGLDDGADIDGLAEAEAEALLEAAEALAASVSAADDVRADGTLFDEVADDEDFDTPGLDDLLQVEPFAPEPFVPETLAEEPLETAAGEIESRLADAEAAALAGLSLEPEESDQAGELELYEAFSAGVEEGVPGPIGLGTEETDAAEILRNAAAAGYRIEDEELLLEDAVLESDEDDGWLDTLLEDDR